MINFSTLIKNVWFRLIFVFNLFLLGYIFTITVIDLLIISPLHLDIRDAKRGISRYEGELVRMERELESIEKKMEEREISDESIRHYYTLYSNPVRYINQHFLNLAKPASLAIIGSSVSPNTTFASGEREKIKPFAKEYGLSRMRNLNKTFSVVRLNLNATGSFMAIGEYISNLYSLPVEFSVREFDLTDNNKNQLQLSLEIGVLVYRMDDADD